MLTQRVKVFTAPAGMPPRVRLNQYDRDTGALSFEVYEETGGTFAAMDLTGLAVRLEATKPDGKGFSYAGTASGSVAVFDVDIQMTAAAGEFPCELRISDGTNDVGTANMVMAVEKAPLGADTDISETVVPAIIDAAASHMAAAAASAEAASASQAAAAGSASAAFASAEAASASRDAALASETAAAASGAAAAASATSAAGSAASAASGAELSESWATGGTGARAGEDADNSRYWSGRAGSYANEARNQADRAAAYASFVTPDYIIRNNHLYLQDAAAPQWALANNRLYIRIVA